MYVREYGTREEGCSARTSSPSGYYCASQADTQKLIRALQLAAEDPADKPVCKPRELTEPSIPKGTKPRNAVRLVLIYTRAAYSEQREE